MIRGPVLPQMRDSLWSLVSSRLDRIESGLTLVMESLDCSDGELGAVDGLARDAMGGPVLVMLAVEGDALLPARALAAGKFLRRVGDALARAVPEANFCPGIAGRVLLIGNEAATATIEQVCALPIPGLHACTLEPFRIAGSERFAIRWATAHGDRDAIDASSPSPSGADESAPEFVVPQARAEIWDAVQEICERIDPDVRVHGDRYARQVSWNGFPLGDIRTVGGALVASAATGVVRDLRDARDVRRFGDQLLRAFAQHARIDLGPFDRDTADPDPSGHHPSEGGPDDRGRRGRNRQHEQDRRAADAGADRLAATRHAVGGRHDVAERGLLSDAAASGGESLRSSLAASRLSPEEYSALGEPASLAGPDSEGSVANDRSQSAPLPDSSVGRSD